MPFNVLMFAALATAQADADALSFEKRVEQAMADYKARDYGSAAAKFDAAYAIRPEPSLVYNAARCYEKIPDIDQAIDRYRKYLGLSGTTAAQRTKARDALSALEREREASRPKPPPPDLPAVTPPPPPPPPSTGPAATALLPPEPRSYVLETTLVSVGVAAIVTGVVFGVLANGETSNYRQALNGAERDEIDSRATRNALIADVAYGTGAAALVVAGALLLFGDDDTGDTR